MNFFSSIFNKTSSNVSSSAVFVDKQYLLGKRTVETRQKENDQAKTLASSVNVPTRSLSSRRSSSPVGWIKTLFASKAAVPVPLTKDQIERATTKEALCELFGRYLYSCHRAGISPSLEKMADFDAVDAFKAKLKDLDGDCDGLVDLAKDTNQSLQSRLGALSMAYIESPDNPVKLKTSINATLNKGLIEFLRPGVLHGAEKNLDFFTQVNLHCIEHADTKPSKCLNGKPGVSCKELWQMRLLQQLGTNHEKGSEALAQCAGDFLKKAVGNKALNDAITNTLKEPKIEDSDKLILESIKTLTFKTQGINFKQIEQMNQKMGKALEWKAGDSSLRASDKLTLKEMAKVSGLASLSKVISTYKLNEKSVCADVSERFQSLLAAHNNYSNLEKKVISAYDSMRTGDLLVYNLDKQTVVQGNSNALQSLMKKTLSYGHPEMVVYDNDKKSFSISDQWNTTRLIPLNLKELSISDVYHFSPSKLVNPKSQELLERAFGSAWQEKVDQLYRDIEQDIHVTSRAKVFGENKFKNDQNRQIAAGAADFIPGGHKRSQERDFEKVALKVLTGQYKEEEATMICSEFAAKTMVAALIELDSRLKDETAKALNDSRGTQVCYALQSKLNQLKNDYNPSQDSAAIEVSEKLLEMLAHDLDPAKAQEPKQYGSDEWDNIVSGLKEGGPTLSGMKSWIDEATAKVDLDLDRKKMSYKSRRSELSGNNRLVDIPFDSHEKLRRLHPGRFMESLIAKGCVNRMDHPETMKALIDDSVQ